MSENNQGDFYVETIFSIIDPQQLKDQELLNRLSKLINEMILHHFDQLIQILYRIDVDEVKLKKILKNNANEDAGIIIAQLIIERQVQKINLRQKIENTLNDAFNEETW